MDLNNDNARPISKLSAQLFAIPLDVDSFIIYAPLRRAAFIGNGAMVSLLAEMQANPAQKQSIQPDLADFLRRLEIVDAAPEVEPITRPEGIPRPTVLTLFMTTSCNLRCTYCYASAGDTPRKAMSLAMAQRGIDFIAANASQTEEHHFEIAYHGGGEPTVNWKVLTASYDYAARVADERGLTFTAAAASNGVLTDEQIDWIVANLRGGVSLSFDGLPSAHDKHRLTVMGQGSSDRVMHTMRRFDAAGYAYGVRVTVTDDQIAQLPSSILFICENFHPTRIQVEPAYQLGRWSNAPSAETDAFITAYRSAQQHAARFGYPLQFSGARLDVLSNHFCGVTRDSFALTPDGTVSACYEAFSEDNPFAHLLHYGRAAENHAGFDFQLPVLNNLRNQAVQHRAYCQGCFAKWHCAGDCYHKALAVGDGQEFQGTDRCHITRELVRDQLLERIAHGGGLFWHEPPANLPFSPSAFEETFA
jgi:uncharacterized protein